MAKGTTVNAESLLKEAEETSRKAGQAIKNLAEQKRDIQRKADKELRALDDQILRLNFLYKSVAGKDHRAVAGSNGHAAGEKGAGKAKRAGKRTRKQGVSAEWVESHLKSPMTLRQLQERAEKAGLSALSVMAVLKKEKSKFKAAEGERKQGVKGKAPQVWSLR